MEKYLFLIPVFNDWKSLNILLGQIDSELSIFEHEFSVVIVNDCSTNKLNIENQKLKKINSIKIINLNKNLGSQGAIAIGLKYLSVLQEKKKIIIMDADGEDNPLVLRKIIDLAIKFPKKIITVNRTKRNEKLIYRLLYEIHYLLTFSTTGKKVRFGNYSLINPENLNKLFATGDLWAAYPSTIVKNFREEEIEPILAERKKRYTDNSKMNLFQLIFHSLRIISVFRRRLIIISIIYISILSLLNIMFGSILFSILTGLILTLNILVFVISLNYKKEDFDNYKNLIKNID